MEFVKAGLGRTLGGLEFGWGGMRLFLSPRDGGDGEGNRSGQRGDGGKQGGFDSARDGAGHSIELIIAHETLEFGAWEVTA